MALSIIESKCLLVLKRLLKFCNLKFFFFFQAEDGIRDLYVTGVQTCALPIYAPGGLDPRVKAALDAGGPAPDYRSQGPALVRSNFNQLAARVPKPHEPLAGVEDRTLEEIGRASCRERVEIAGVALPMKNKQLC